MSACQYNPSRDIRLRSTVIERQTCFTPIIDDDLHAVVVPIGNSIRVAGTAKLAGTDTIKGRIPKEFAI